MAIDMKKTIAEAASSLLFEKRVKKLTVKDIVEECHITRQAFYYHFEDIPDLIHWVLYQEVDVILEECMAEQDIERGIRHFFSLAAQLRPYAIRGIQSSYGDEIGRLLEQFFYDLFQKVVDLQNWYEGYSEKDRQFILHYHCQAVMGLLREWTKQDTENINYIVHQIYLLLMGKSVMVSKEDDSL